MKYRTIVVDPPWAYRQRRPGEAPTYRVEAVAEIAAMPIGDYADADAHMYLWTTNAFMCEAHDLMKAWGFEQKTILTWIKAPIRLGYWFRNNTEHVLFGVRGTLAALRKDCPTAFFAVSGRHSEKPQAFYDMVETMSPGPYLDVFARKQRMGWDVAGNEVYSVIPELAAKGESHE